MSQPSHRSRRFLSLINSANVVTTPEVLKREMHHSAASPSAEWALVEDLVDSVRIYPDQITVEVAGAPPFVVALDEVGLTQGCKPNRCRRRHMNPHARRGTQRERGVT